MQATVAEKRQVAKGTVFVRFAVEDYPDYRPGAIAPEMPTQFVGRRETRKATAEVYANRAEAAAIAVRNGLV